MVEFRTCLRVCINLFDFYVYMNIFEACQPMSMDAHESWMLITSICIVISDDITKITMVIGCDSFPHGWLWPPCFSVGYSRILVYVYELIWISMNLQLLFTGLPSLCFHDFSMIPESSHDKYSQILKFPLKTKCVSKRFESFNGMFTDPLHHQMNFHTIPCLVLDLYVSFLLCS